MATEIISTVIAVILLFETCLLKSTYRQIDTYLFDDWPEYTAVLMVPRPIKTHPYKVQSTPPKRNKWTRAAAAVMLKQR
jgi:hypothetical protein